MDGGNFVFDLSCANYTEYTKDGFINVQVDGDGDGATMPTFEVHHPYGMISRPRDPKVDAQGLNPSGPLVLYAWEGDRGHAWFQTDSRVAARLPNTIEPGGTLLYADRDDGQLSIVRLRGTDGAFIAYVPGAKQGSYFQIDPADGGDLSTPWGRIQCGRNGLILSHISGAVISLGSIGGLPAPMSALASYVDIAAATISLTGSVVNIGTDGGAASQAGLEALYAFLAALVVQIAKITAVTPGATAMADPTFAALLSALPLAIAPIGKIA